MYIRFTTVNTKLPVNLLLKILKHNISFSGLEQAGFIKLMKPTCSNPENSVVCLTIGP